MIDGTRSDDDNNLARAMQSEGMTDPISADRPEPIRPRQEEPKVEPKVEAKPEVKAQQLDQKVAGDAAVNELKGKAAADVVGGPKKAAGAPPALPGEANGLRSERALEAKAAIAANPPAPTESSAWQSFGDTVSKAATVVAESSYGRYTRGFVDAGVDAVVGIKDMAVGAANLTGLRGQEAQQGTKDTIANVANAMVADPVGVAKEIVKPVTERWEKGDHAGALGYGVASVAASLLGGKGLDKAATLSRGGQAATKVDDLVSGAGRVAASKADDIAKKSDELVDLNSPVQKKLAELDASKPDPFAFEKRAPDVRDAGRIDEKSRRLGEDGYKDLSTEEYARVSKHAQRVGKVDEVAAKYADVIKELPIPLRDALLGEKKFDMRSGSYARNGGVRNSIPSPDDLAGAIKESRGQVYPHHNKPRPYNHDMDVEGRRYANLRGATPDVDGNVKRGAIQSAEDLTKQYRLSDVQKDAVNAYLQAAKEATLHAAAPGQRSSFSAERAANIARVNKELTTKGRNPISNGNTDPMSWKNGQQGYFNYND